MKVKTSELQGATLDWAVAQCEDLEHYFADGLVCLKGQPFDTHWLYWTPSTDWAQGGPIIERERIRLDPRGVWVAGHDSSNDEYTGPTPLIAAMRCYVASKMDEEIEIPEELK